MLSLASKITSKPAMQVEYQRSKIFLKSYFREISIVRMLASVDLWVNFPKLYIFRFFGFTALNF